MNPTVGKFPILFPDNILLLKRHGNGAAIVPILDRVVDNKNILTEDDFAEVCLKVKAQLGYNILYTIYDYAVKTLWYCIIATDEKCNPATFGEMIATLNLALQHGKVDIRTDKSLKHILDYTPISQYLWIPST